MQVPCCAVLSAHTHSSVRLDAGPKSELTHSVRSISQSAVVQLAQRNAGAGASWVTGPAPGPFGRWIGGTGRVSRRQKELVFLLSVPILVWSGLVWLLLDVWRCLVFRRFGSAALC